MIKLKQEQTDAVPTLRQLGFTDSEIADKFGISADNFEAIYRASVIAAQPLWLRKAYAHVEAIADTEGRPPSWIELAEAMSADKEVVKSYNDEQGFKGSDRKKSLHYISYARSTATEDWPIQPRSADRSSSSRSVRAELSFEVGGAADGDDAINEAAAKAVALLAIDEISKGGDVTNINAALLHAMADVDLNHRHAAATKKAAAALFNKTYAKAMAENGYEGVNPFTMRNR